MSLAEFLEDPKSATTEKDQLRPLDPAAKLRKQVFLQFGAIVVLGLALTGWYVGFRIFTGVGTPRPAVPVATATKPIAPRAQMPALPPTETKSVAVAIPPPVIPAADPKPPVKDTPPKPAATPTPLPAPPAVEHNPVATPAPPVAPPIAKAKPKDSTAQPFRRRDASPRSGERYLQIAAFGPRALDGYLKTLESQGLHPVVAPGPVDSIYRILVGPFPNAGALEETRQSIKASGIDPILRTY